MPYDPFDLTGKVALITGGNGGIGLGMAEGLARAGARVVIWGMKPEKNAAAEAQLKVHGGDVLVRPVDVSDEAAVVAGIDDALRAMGRLDFVAANAGVAGWGKAFIDTDTGEWRRVTTVDLDAVFWTVREACKHMVARHKAGDSGGSIVVTSSTSAIHGSPRNQAYSASKAAIGALIRGVAVEHAKHGVRANALMPGWVRSDLTAPLQAWDTFNEKAIGRVPMGRWGEPDDFGGIAVYLASEASRFHTGDSIVIDGGYTVY